MNAVAGDFAAQHFKKLAQGAFGGAVTGAAEHRHPARHRANGGNLSAAFPQQGQGCQGQFQRCVIVDGHHLAKHGHCGLGGGRAMGDAGVVDQQVQPAETLPAALQQQGVQGRVGNVAGDGQESLVAQLLGASRQAWGVDIGQQQGVAAGMAGAG